jgi:hypothetical protein
MEALRAGLGLGGFSPCSILYSLCINSPLSLFSLACIIHSLCPVAVSALVQLVSRLFLCVRRHSEPLFARNLSYSASTKGSHLPPFSLSSRQRDILPSTDQRARRSKSPADSLSAMYSCINYPRGCRGRVNVQGGKCADCVVCLCLCLSFASASTSSPNKPYSPSTSAGRRRARRPSSPSHGTTEGPCRPSCSATRPTGRPVCSEPGWCEWAGYPSTTT